MDESGWIGKGSCGGEHCDGSARGRSSWSRQDSAGFYQRKYRHCLRNDRSGSRFPGHVVHAGERLARAQAHSAFHGIEGAKHMATAIVPKICDASLADEDIGISTEDAHAMVRQLAREEGLLVGISAGAAVAGCLQVARSLGKNQQAVFVTILPDSGDKYLSERFWEEG